jgi:hypothetical protein
MEREAALLEERCRALRQTLRGWDRRLGRTPRGRQARLLDHLERGPERSGSIFPLRNPPDTGRRRPALYRLSD